MEPLAAFGQGHDRRERRLLQKSFAYYLAPDVIDKMLASNKLPQLGGETREVTVLFSDLAERRYPRAGTRTVCERLFRPIPKDNELAASDKLPRICEAQNRSDLDEVRHPQPIMGVRP